MASLIIPFATNDERRQRIFDWVIERWRRQFPDWEICVGEDDPEDFNRSRARNNAFAQSTEDLIVISDADTITTTQNVQQALTLVESMNRPWVIAHDLYYSLTESFTDALLKEAPDVDLGLIHDWPSNWRMVNKSEAGVLVMPREAYETIGGYDERYQGWGYEDNAFCWSLDHRWGMHSRSHGPMLHLWHDPGDNFNQPNIGHNLELFEGMRHAV